MPAGKPFKIDVQWDPEACVFTAASEDVPGLVAEAVTLAQLDRKLCVVIPELLELNHVEGADPAAGFVLHIRS